MSSRETFDAFSNGKLTGLEKSFGNIKWYLHPKFEGVEMKDIITSEETEGKFSFHLVKIAPEKKIGLHIHENQLETHEVIFGEGLCKTEDKEYTYESGRIAIFPAKTKHEITAGAEGLYIFAKFIPALK